MKQKKYRPMLPKKKKYRPSTGFTAVFPECWLLIYDLNYKIYHCSVGCASCSFYFMLQHQQSLSGCTNFCEHALQVLQERGESTSRHGRATFSVLLFQVRFLSNIPDIN